MEVDRTVVEVAQIAYADPLKLLGDDGKLLPMHLWPVEIAAAVQSVEFADDGSVRKVRFWSKPNAVTLAMRFHGLISGDREPPPPPDPELDAKRKKVLDAAYELLDRKARGLDWISRS